MIRGLRVMVVATSALLTIGLGHPASAEDCSSSHPTCLTDDVEEAADDAVLDVVEDAAEDAGGAVTPVVNDVIDEVDRLTGGGSEPPPGGGGGGGGGGTGNGGGGGGGGDGDGAGGGGSAEDPLRQGSGLPGSTVVLVTSATDPNIPIDRDPSLRDRFAAAVAGAARSFAVVLILLFVAIGFVLIQDRLDRRDPKLVLAPVGSDVVPFT